MIEPKNLRGPKGAAKHRWFGVVVALMLGALAAVSLLALESPDPLPASAPSSEFSAERAFSHVEQIAKRPHPVGSPENAEVRDYLLGQLEDLGLRVRADDGGDGLYSARAQRSRADPWVIADRSRRARRPLRLGAERSRSRG
jgi:hypothetical protein